MTPSDIDSALATYGAGLDAELTLLRQLQELSARQQAAATADLDDLHRVADARERAMEALLGLEATVAPVRASIAAHVDLARSRPAFTEIATLHSVARSLVAEILGGDRKTLSRLREAADTRRQLAQTLEAGGNALAAYRRVIAPPTNPSLVDQQG
jgi:hypothetical protein